MVDILMALGMLLLAISSLISWVIIIFDSIDLRQTRGQVQWLSNQVLEMQKHE